MKRSSGPRKTANLSESLHRQLNMYTLVASAAGVSALALAQRADAKIVYTPAQVNLGHNGQTIRHLLDLNHDGIVDFALCLSVVTYISFLSISPNIGNEVIVARAQRPPFATSSFNSAVALPRGAKIGNHDYFNAGRASMAAIVFDPSEGFLWKRQWANGGKGLKNGFLGLKFMIKGKVHFGWARVTVKTSENFTFTATLTGYAYETIPGKGIVAGQTKGTDDIPEGADATLSPPTSEPASLGALAMGAPGLSIWRREESVLPASIANGY